MRTIQEELHYQILRGNQQLDENDALRALVAQQAQFIQKELSKEKPEVYQVSEKFKKKTAKKQLEEVTKVDVLAPLEALRFFCSVSMNSQDWLDAEPLFEALKKQSEPFGWIKKRDLESSRRHGGSINLWLCQFDCDTPVYLSPNI